MAGRKAGGSDVVRRVDERLGIAEEVEFFGDGPQRLFGCRHVPVASEPSRFGVVICSPILTDFGANYRREVELARRLAAAGVTVQRFHPRGTGHSDGDRTDLTMATMVEDTLAAVDRLLDRGSVESAGLVATRFAALPASAVAGRLGAVPLVLWEPVLQARRYFREGLRAESVHRLKHGGSGVDDPDAELDRAGFIDILGIPVGRDLFHSDASHDRLAALGDTARSLLLVQLERRDGLKPEYRAAVAGWTTAGLDVTTALAPTDESWWFVPDRLTPADDVVDLTVTWLLDRADQFPMLVRNGRHSDHYAPTFETGIGPCRHGSERPVFVAASTGELLAVVTEPPAAVEPTGIAAITLRGAGWRPSSGPRRTQTRTTRALAAIGFHGVRFSYHGIAESGGIVEDVVRLDRPYVADARAVCDWARNEGLRPLLIGNCFGARTALAAAADDPTVAGLVLLVPPVHDFEVARRLDRRPLSHFARRLAPRHVTAVLRDRHRRQALGRTGRAMLDVAGARLRRRTRPGGGSDRSTAAHPEWLSRRFMDQLTSVLDRDLPVLFVYGDDDPYGKDFERAMAGPLGALLERPGAPVRIERVPGRVHGLTRHDTQDAVLAAIVDWVSTDLAAAVAAGALR